jgi:hypothetical protein
MTTKPKSFDCVEMKRQAQEKLLAEWEHRKCEFPTYGAFLDATVQESEWCKRIWERTMRKKSPAPV